MNHTMELLVATWFKAATYKHFRKINTASQKQREAWSLLATEAVPPVGDKTPGYWPHFSNQFGGLVLHVSPDTCY